MKKAWQRRSKAKDKLPPVSAAQDAARQNGSAAPAQPLHEGEHGTRQRILVVGGTGRVGASTVAALLKVREPHPICPPCWPCRGSLGLRRSSTSTANLMRSCGHLTVIAFLMRC